MMMMIFLFSMMIFLYFPISSMIFLYFPLFSYFYDDFPLFSYFLYDFPLFSSIFPIFSMMIFLFSMMIFSIFLFSMMIFLFSMMMMMISNLNAVKMLLKIFLNDKHHPSFYIRWASWYSTTQKWFIQNDSGKAKDRNKIWCNIWIPSPTKLSGKEMSIKVKLMILILTCLYFTSCWYLWERYESNYSPSSYVQNSKTDSAL